MADVDCTAAGKPLCDSNGIKGFPTIKYGDPSDLQTYEGGRDDPNLLMLRFELGDAEIWEADPGIKGSFKLLTGMTMKPGDAGEHVRTAL